MKIIVFAFSDVSELLIIFHDVSEMLITFCAVNEQHILHHVREFGSQQICAAMKVKCLFRAVKELTFSTGNGIEMTAGRAQCDNKMTILSEKRYFVLLMNSMFDTPFE